MAYTIVYENRKGYLRAHISGPESFEEASRFWEGLQHEGAGRLYDTFLVVDEVSGVLTQDEIYTLSVNVALLFAGKTIAYVDPKNESFDANRYGESVVASRQVTVRLFRTEPDAVKWLEKQQSRRPSSGAPRPR